MMITEVPLYCVQMTMQPDLEKRPCQDSRPWQHVASAMRYEFRKVGGLFGLEIYKIGMEPFLMMMCPEDVDRIEWSAEDPSKMLLNHERDEFRLNFPSIDAGLEFARKLEIHRLRNAQARYDSRREESARQALQCISAPLARDNGMMWLAVASILYVTCYAAVSWCKSKK